MKSIRIAIAGALVLAAIVAAFRVIRPPAPPEAHELLRQVYTPHFRPVPAPPSLDEMIAVSRSELGFAFTRRFARGLLPTQTGTLWIALLVMLVAGFNVERLRDPRNIDLLAAFVLGLLFFNILGLAYTVRHPFWLGWLRWIFGAVVGVSLTLMVRAVRHALARAPSEWRPALRGRTLAALAMLMLALDVSAGIIRAPDDSGYFVNLGAQRLRERGRLPYGDPMLTGTPGAAYGPLLYVAQVPFQLLVDPARLNASSTPRPPLGPDSTYRLPSPLAAQLYAIAFQLLAAALLFVAARRFGRADLGWALVALYCGSPFVIGMGGEEYYIGGMTYISHIGPPAVTIAAFAALSRPLASGALLVAATGCGFYPAFLLPAWAGHYWTRRRDLSRFLSSVAVSGVLLGIFVLAFSRSAGNRGLVGTILWDTFGHHSDPAGYGASPFGFWGQRSGILAWLIHPLVGASGLTAPVMLLFFAFAASSFFLARGRGARELALLSAAVVIGSNLVKIHATGTYVTWFYPFLLLGLFLPPRPAESLASVTIEDSACQSGPDHRPS